MVIVTTEVEVGRTVELEVMVVVPKTLTVTVLVGGPAVD